jgi:hypothetical protein
MMKDLITGALALGLAGSSAALPAERTVTLAVQNMYCAACPLTSRRACKRWRGSRPFMCPTRIRPQ